MPALRCTFCANDYPVHSDYEICPICEEPTNGFRNIKAMPNEEARSIKNHADFERYYEEHSRRRKAADLA